MNEFVLLLQLVGEGVNHEIANAFLPHNVIEGVTVCILFRLHCIQT